MRLLLTGATGYIGTAVAARLTEAGHDVVALVRPTSTTSGLPAGTTIVPGDITDPAALRAAASDVDGVVHVAPSGGADVDRAAARAYVDALRGRGGPLVWTTGVWVLGPTESAATEDSPAAPIAIVSDRPAVERLVLTAADEGVRAVVLRPGVVHGRGRGIPAMLVDGAREAGVGQVVGAGDARWPMVHVDDLADLYLAAVERASAGAVLHGVTEEGVRVADLAAAAASAAGLAPRTAVVPLAEAADRFGAPFAEALALRQAVSASRTRFALGWHPRRPGAVADVAAGSYGALAGTAGSTDTAGTAGTADAA